MNNVTKSPIIVALDNMSMEASLTLADQLDPALCRLKVGKELLLAVVRPSFRHYISVTLMCF